MDNLNCNLNSESAAAIAIESDENLIHKNTEIKTMNCNYDPENELHLSFRKINPNHNSTKIMIN